MHVHVPKPLHGWRAFAGEVGIIVLGVLIALGAEQVVEEIHERAELRDAETAMTSELREDDLPQAFTRAAIYDCYSNQLDGIERAVASGDRAKTLSLAKAYKPIIRTWDDQAWQAAVASQVLVHSGSKRILDWAGAYVMVPVLGKGGAAEQDELPKLDANLSGQGPLTAPQQDRLFEAVSELRRDNRDMAGASLVFIRTAGSKGLAVTNQQKATLLSEARAKFGGCVSEPTPEKMNLNTQLTTASVPPGND
jgi:hypothetical protein